MASTVYRGDPRQQPISVRCCRSCRIVLPALVLVRVGVVADAANDNARVLVHDASRFHLEADDMVLLLHSVALDGGYLQLVARRHVAEVNGRPID